jgi:hypothetical protein
MTKIRMIGKNNDNDRNGVSQTTLTAIQTMHPLQQFQLTIIQMILTLKRIQVAMNRMVLTVVQTIVAVSRMMLTVIRIILTMDKMKGAGKQMAVPIKRIVMIVGVAALKHQQWRKRFSRFAGLYSFLPSALREEISHQKILPLCGTF